MSKTKIKSIWVSKDLDFSIVLNDVYGLNGELTCLDMNQAGGYCHCGVIEGNHLGKKISYNDLNQSQKNSLSKLNYVM